MRMEEGEAKILKVGFKICLQIKKVVKVKHQHQQVMK